MIHCLKKLTKSQKRSHRLEHIVNSVQLLVAMIIAYNVTTSVRSVNVMYAHFITHIHANVL